MELLWVRMMKKQRIIGQETMAMGDLAVLDVLQELCAKLDIPRPLWLNKHARDYEQFGHTAFTQEHFMEHIAFDRLEIERMDPEAEKRTRKDPRNEV